MVTRSGETVPPMPSTRSGDLRVRALHGSPVVLTFHDAPLPGLGETNGRLVRYSLR